MMYTNYFEEKLILVANAAGLQPCHGASPDLKKMKCIV